MTSSPVFAEVSDSAVTVIVAGAIQITGMVIGFLTLWVKLKHAGMKAEEAVDKAAIVERKIDANTAMTSSVDTKTNTIVQQTDGSMDKVRALVEAMTERVSKLEDYNRNNAHRTIDAINAVHLKVAELIASQRTLATGPAALTPPRMEEAK